MAANSVAACERDKWLEERVVGGGRWRGAALLDRCCLAWASSPAGSNGGRNWQPAAAPTPFRNCGHEARTIQKTPVKGDDEGQMPDCISSEKWRGEQTLFTRRQDESNWIVW